MSIITPPKVRPPAELPPLLLFAECLHGMKVTLGILEKAKELGTPALWLQPGAEDETVIEYIKNNDLKDRVIYGGPCILVEGDDIIRSNLTNSNL